MDELEEFDENELDFFISSGDEDSENYDAYSKDNGLS